jgi:CRP-like cAMP-binding protein
MTFEKYPKNTLMIKQGHIGTCFYFVLSGQVEAFKLFDGEKKRFNLMNPGNLFGERILQPGDGKRTASVATTVDSYFLRVWKNDYLEILHDARNLTAKRQVLEPLIFLPVFSDHKEFLEKLITFFNIYQFGENHMIQEEGLQTLELFWILEGTCKVVQNVSFVQRLKKLEGFTEDTVLGEEEKKVTVPLQTQELLTGDSFPPFPVLGEYDQIKYCGSDLLDKEKYVNFFSNLGADDPKTLSSTSVVSISKVIVAAIQFNDFVQLAPKPILYSMIVHPSVGAFSMESLQNGYLEQLKWKEHRKSIIVQAGKS